MGANPSSADDDNFHGTAPFRLCQFQQPLQVGDGRRGDGKRHGIALLELRSEGGNKAPVVAGNGRDLYLSGYGKLAHLAAGQQKRYLGFHNFNAAAETLQRVDP
ncbi:hypothetical protein SDC9_192706 [bioreactor metagenome]|uniref:Uncharacterized protein n=1 Tax=bioreactor metagenome TaxID=1076179 RepID=A0A645I3V5_9ZZZZ